MRTLDVVENEWFSPLTAKDSGTPREIRPALPKSGADLAAWCRMVKERKAENDLLREREREVVLHACLMNEVDYVQMTGRRDERGKMMRVHFWQACMLLDNIVVAFCGRDVGKSTVLKWSIEQRCTNYPTGIGMISGNQDWRVKKPWNELVMKEMREVASLKDGYLKGWARHFLAHQDGSSSSRNPYHQWFCNGLDGGTGHVLWGIPAGEGKATRKVESPHVHYIAIDEMQEYNDIAWAKLGPALNEYGENIAHGAMRKFFGVNSEGRIDTVFYRIAHQHSFYQHHCYRIPSWYNPKYGLERHKEFLHEYGFSIDASEFKQMVRGLTGERSKGLIDQKSYNRCCLVGREVGLTFRNIVRIGKEQWAQAHQQLDVLFEREILAKYDAHTIEKTVLSMDYGSSNPSEIGIWHQIVNPRAESDLTRLLWLLWQRVTVVGLQGHDQAAIVDYLADRYHAQHLSVDSTGSTDVISQILTDPRNPIYLPKGYEKRVYPAASNRDIPIRYQEQEPENRALAPAGMKWKKIEINAKGGWKFEVWALLQNSNVLSARGVSSLIGDGIVAMPGLDNDLQLELLSIVEKIQEGIAQPKYHGLHGQHRFSMLRSFAQWYHQYYTLRNLQRDILGEEDFDDEETDESPTGLAALFQGGSVANPEAVRGGGTVSLVGLGDLSPGKRYA